MTGALRQEISSRKEEIINWLRKSEAATDSAPPPILPVSPDQELALSFAQPRGLEWETLERFVSDLALADLESLKLLDRYEGPGVAQGEVKTTIRLTFRSSERTLEQAEVNRETDRLAAQYQFTARFVFTHGTQGFSAQLAPEVLAAVRCEPSVSFTEYNGTVTVAGP